MRFLIPSLLATSLAVHATTVPFETATDLSDYTTVITSNSTLVQGAALGAGDPASGGLSYAGDSGGSDRSFIAYRSLNQTGNTWTQSILLNPKNFDALATDKCELRIGFATTNTVNTSKPTEFFHKSNPSISLRLNAENKTAESKNRYLEALLTNRVAAETNSATSFVNNSVHFDDWLRVSLTIQQNGTDTFATSYIIESLGANGTAPPTVVLSSAPVTLTNATFAAASTFHTGFAVKNEKNLTTTAFLDDHSFEISTVPPGAPSADAATTVAADGLTANWQAPSGVQATSYIVQLTTASNNFTPGTFISSTGATGQATGVTVGNINTLAFTNLLPSTAYRYRIIAVNAAGQSIPSASIDATTLNSGINSPPTLDSIADRGPVHTAINPILVPLTGLTAGGEAGQTVSVTVTPANTAIIASGSVSAPDPSGNATLTLIPTGTPGSSLVTLLVNDGQTSNNTTSQAFTITVRDPIETLGFATAAEITELFIIQDSNVNHAWFANAGTGDPASGGVLVSTTNTTGDRGFAAWRSQGELANGATFLRTSLALNAANLDDILSTQEAGIEIRLGYTATTNSSGKPNEFLHKQNDSLHAKFKLSHKPSDPGKIRFIEVEPSSAVGGVETKGTKLAAINAPSINDWLLLTFDVYPLGGSEFSTSWKIESLGEFGTDAPTIVLRSAPFTFTNAPLAAASLLYSAYAGKFDKQLTSIRLDDHRSFVDRNAPDAPVAQAPTLVTATSFHANWQPGSNTPASSFILEVVPDGSPFTSGNFISASGMTGQTAGIVIHDGQLRALRIEGLTGAAAYRYRLSAANVNGTSPVSAEVGVTTLPPGINAPPTLTAIPNPAPIAINAALQTINLTGIGSGGETGQTLTVTAVSSNPALIPTPTVIYTSPNPTGSLTFTPVAGAVGSANITVTVSDGAANNNSVQRVF